MRSRQAQLYWLLGDERCQRGRHGRGAAVRGRVTWPDALAELALPRRSSRAGAATPAEARQQLGVAATLLGDEAEQPVNIRAAIHDLLGYLADDLGEARTHRAAACQAASEVGTRR